jgi:hypothetical protein
MRVPGRVGLFLAIALMGIVIALGTNTPYWRFLARAGGIFGAIRVPARGIVLFLLALGVLASWGLSQMTRGVPRSRRLVAIAAALLLTGLEYRAAPMTLYDVDPEPAAVYRWLAQARFPGAVVELPLGLEPDFEYVFRSAHHNRPIVNGYSGFHPPVYVEIAQLFERQPIPDSVWDRIQTAGATIVVLHPRRLEDSMRRIELARFVLRAVAEGRLEPIAVFPAQDEDDLVFRFRDPDAPPGVSEASVAEAKDAVAELSREMDRLAPPFGVLDWPRDGGVMDPGSSGWGWALDDSGVAEIVVSADDLPALVHRGPRPDLPPELSRYPDSARAGFAFPLPALAPGRHELKVEWRANDGGVTILRREFEVRGAKGPPAPARRVPPFGFLDSPRERESVQAGAEGYGWALDDSGIADIVVSVGNRRIPSFRSARPDLPPELSRYPDAQRAGFGFTLPPLPPGRYDLRIVWRANDGGVTTLRRSIEVSPMPPTPAAARP